MRSYINLYSNKPFISKIPLFFYNKDKKLKYLNMNSSVLYGYKFHFVGRFTRKQKSANLWFLRGAVSFSNVYAKIDYGVYTVILRYSICTVKVWLYRSFIAPKYYIKVI